jgi:hypothetical protein
MIEVYVLLTLTALGYLLNKTSNEVKQSNNNTIHVNEIPSMKNIYESTYYTDTDLAMRQKADKKFQASLDPVNKNVISHDYGMIRDNLKEDQEKEKVLSLSGEYISKENFTHQNMVPFYGGAIKQNMDDKANRVLLETFTGVSDLQKNKCEVGSFYDLSKGNIHGSQDSTDYYKDRIVAPTNRANEFPIPQLHVGPGIGEGYSSTPTGGYQQFEAQDFAKSRCVDQLRTKLNPNKNAIGITDNQKKTYEGRVVEGLKVRSGVRGSIGKVNKNRVERSYEQTEDMWFKTTGANLKPTKNGDWDVKETNRQTTSKQQIGTAFASGQLARKYDSKVKQSSRQQLKGNYFGTGSLDKYGLGSKYDYGKSQILVYNNERDITTTKVYQGNVTSLIKAIMAPIEDMIKVTKKQEGVNNPRHFGNMKIQFPSKQTIYDPNDVARPTIKETTIHEYILGNLKGNEKLTIYDPNDVAKTTVKETVVHEYLLGNLKGNEKLTIYDPNDVAKTTIKQTTVQDYILGNLKGNEKLTIYDPNDVARTTIKQTTVHDYILGNLKGNEKQTIYDPNDVARTTIKEMTVHDSILGNLKGNEKQTIYDPNDVARTTVKETLIHDENGTGTLTGAKQLYVYDPEVVAKMTIRETVERDDYELNMAARVYKGTLYDPDDTARKTIKESTVDLEREFGNLDRYAKAGGYETNEYDAKDTQKQFLSDYDYYGGAMRDGGEGYITNEYDAKDTQKQFLSDYEYFGTAAGAEEKKQMSYDEYFNARIREKQEVLLNGREPTLSGVKVFNDCMNVATPRKNECDLKTERESLNHTHISNEIPTLSDYTITKMRKNSSIEGNDRLDVSLLNAFRECPYQIDITKNL